MRFGPILSLALTAAFSITVATAAHAVTITAGSTTSVVLGGTAPGSASNYDFGDFGSGGQPTHLTDFSVSTGAASYQYPGNMFYSTLTAPGGTGPFTTGVAVTDGSAQELIGTFQSLSQSSFDVYLLTGNGDNINITTSSVALGVNGGTPVVVNTDPNAYMENNFVEYTITGATPGDTFQFYSTSTGIGLALMGGITFGAAASPVPEPSSLVLLGTGVLGVMGAVRRRFVKA